MKWSFRQRLLIGHILPILILGPLLGFLLISLIETQLVIPALANDMIDQGLLVARLTQGNDRIWDSPQQAQALLDTIPPRPPTQIGLINRNGILLATNRPEDHALVGKPIASLRSNGNTSPQPGWAIEPHGQTGEPLLATNVPVTGPNGALVGVVRIYRRIADIEQIFADLRLIILSVVVIGLLASSVITYLLSASFDRSLQRLTQLIADAPLEGEVPPLPEEGDQELRAIIRAYNRLQKRRQELEQNREQLLNNLIHEIGRPLGSLRAAVHALQAGAAADLKLRDDLLRAMAERIMRMGRLLQDLSFSYRRLAPLELNIQRVQVQDWLNGLTPLWVENARENGLQWRCVVEENLPLLKTDPDRLAQALSNLISNALKYAPTGGKVSLCIRRSGEEIVFTVQDNGPGISREDQSHLFKPFFRSKETAEKAPGLGLGLAISRSIIESMGGKIALESVPGQGSTFTISLPL